MKDCNGLDGGILEHFNCDCVQLILRKTLGTPLPNANPPVVTRSFAKAYFFTQKILHWVFLPQKKIFI